MVVRTLATVVPENSVRFLGHDTHEHDEPHLVYAAAGTVELTVDDEVLTLRRGEAVWLAPFVPHAVRLSDGGMALGPMLHADVVPGQRFRVLGVVPALVDVMTTVLGAAPSGDQIEPFRSAIGEILQRLQRQYFAVIAPTHPVGRRLAREAVRSPYTLVQLSERHHLSPRQVQRIFLDETGLPFARWRSRARMNAAVAHLEGGGSPSSAARLAGYSTRAGLLRALSRETGVALDVLAAAPVEALLAAETTTAR
ncbi:AraC family transcriptional regulator [Plantibacter flavus]|uniref:helix-turn-helix domain-containing protein n=1 Tax=Plantibacter flavus TaxID=150123 RepID=UPI003F14C42E